MTPLTGNGEDDELFRDYIKSVNKFFHPKSDKEANNIFSTFIGKVSTNNEGMFIIPNSFSLKKILVPGELNPSEWPKFRYLLLELWNINTSIANVEFKKNLLQAIKACRSDVYGSLLRREISAYLKENVLDDLPGDDEKRIKQECINKFSEALRGLGVKITEEDKKSIISSRSLFVTESDEP